MVEIPSYVTYHYNIILVMALTSLFSILPVGSTIVLETRFFPEYSLTTMM